MSLDFIYLFIYLFVDFYSDRVLLSHCATVITPLGLELFVVGEYAANGDVWTSARA